MTTLHVVAAIVRDPAGRVLLAQRRAGKHLAGLWEFPGGKCEPGETPEIALRRELYEELGIHAGALQRMIAVPWSYPEKNILLDVYRVQDYSGSVRGCEGQALRWELPTELDSVDMPDADRPVLTALRLPAHYVISPEPSDAIDGFVHRLEKLLRNGERCIQIRSKRLDCAVLRGIVTRVRDIAAPIDAQILINAHIGLARETGVGVHLPSCDLTAIQTRPLSRDALVAASCHNAEELAHAARINADFAVLGPVLPTSSHAHAPTLGWEQFARLCADARLPVFALGGMELEHEAMAIAAGAQGIAGISAFWR